jgi:hypothetical protein
VTEEKVTEEKVTEEKVTEEKVVVRTGDKVVVTRRTTKEEMREATASRDRGTINRKSSSLPAKTSRNSADLDPT